MKWFKSILTGTIGAALTGGMAAAAQAYSSGVIDKNAVTSAAVAGAALSVANYWLKSPREE